MYAGDPDNWKEYRERVMDYCYGCRHEDQKNAVIRLRSGLTGRAFDSVRDMEHKDLLCKGDGQTTEIENDRPHAELPDDHGDWSPSRTSNQGSRAL